MKATGKEIIVKMIERQGITHIAGIPGGANLPMYDALGASPIRHVLARHEQGAGFIAQGMARVSGRPEVCWGTSGPGATNLLTAVADARLDSIPMVIVTGQVPLSMIGTDAFQEIDTYGLMVPITKHNWLARSAGELLELIPEAFSLAASGRPGPVAIDVPKDVQNQEVEFDAWPEPGRPESAAPAAPELVAEMAKMISRAKRPVMLVGQGAVQSGACDAVRRLMRRGSIPASLTLLGLGAVASDDPLNLGMLGMHGARFTNLALAECDLLIALGMRFDDRATGLAEQFCPQASIIHVDIDASELGKIKRPALAIQGDLAQVLEALEPVLEPVDRSEWLARIAELKDRHPMLMPGADDTRRPYGLIRQIAALADDDAIVATDVGQHQMWTAQAWPFRQPRTWLTSGGLGTMGFGLPAAIGAALAEPERTVLCFTGDGSIMMNLQEMATAAELGVNVKVIVMNNGHLGLVRQQQALFYGGRFNASRFEARADFPAIARGMGLAAWDLEGAEDPLETLARALAAPGPCLINAPIHAEEDVYPMVPPGAANTTMIGGETHVHANA